MECRYRADSTSHRPASEVALTAIDYVKKCDAPAKDFVAFAKGLTLARGAPSLAKLIADPAADRFGNRLLSEALSGEAHAGTCLVLVGHLVNQTFWLAKLRSSDAAGCPPSPDQIPAAGVEAASRALCAIYPGEAVPWIALAYLTRKGSPKLRSSLQSILVEAASTPGALLEGLSRAAEALEAAGEKIPRSAIERSVAAIEASVAGDSTSRGQPTLNGIARLSGLASRTELVRLVTALSVLPSLGQGATVHGDAIGAPGDAAAPRTEDVIGEAAWSQADEALARALQNAAALRHALDRAKHVDAAVSGYVGIVAQ